MYIYIPMGFGFKTEIVHERDMEADTNRHTERQTEKETTTIAREWIAR